MSFPSYVPHNARPLIAEALGTRLTGGDLSWLGDWIKMTPPWEFATVVSSEASRGRRMLDIGTSGGEWLGSLQQRSPFTVATESWTANVSLAADPGTVWLRCRRG
jgi:hypothetical protein